MNVKFFLIMVFVIFTLLIWALTGFYFALGFDLIFASIIWFMEITKQKNY